MTDPTRSDVPEPWHVSAADLGRYARGESPPGQAASIEPHLVGCTICQQAVADSQPVAASAIQRRLSLVLDEVMESVDGPTPRLLERSLVRVGVHDHVARLVAASPQLERSWLGAVAAVLVFTVMAAQSGEIGLGFFLVVAPLLPLAVVAASFSVGRGTLAELTTTMPVGAWWLLLIRTVSVLVPTLVMCGAAAIAMPGQGWEQAAWVLPSLALSSMTAALSTWIRPTTAAVTLTSAWIGVLIVASGRTVRLIDAGDLTQRAALFAPSGQVVALALTCISIAVLILRHETLDTRSSM